MYVCSYRASRDQPLSDGQIQLVKAPHVRCDVEIILVAHGTYAGHLWQTTRTTCAVVLCCELRHFAVHSGRQNGHTRSADRSQPHADRRSATIRTGRRTSGLVHHLNVGLGDARPQPGLRFEVCCLQADRRNVQNSLVLRFLLLRHPHLLTRPGRQEKPEATDKTCKQMKCRIWTQITARGAISRSGVSWCAYHSPCQPHSPVSPTPCCSDECTA